MEKSEKIIQTAERLFYKYGFKGVGVDAIRDESGCSKTTLYKIFSNKENLIKQVLRYRDDEFRASLIQYVGDRQGVEAVVKIMAWHHDWFSQPDFNGCLFVRSIAELSDVSDHSTDVAIDHKEWVRHFIFDKIQDRPNAQSISDQLFIILEGQINSHLMYKNNLPMCERFLEQGRRMVEMLMQDEWHD